MHTRTKRTRLTFAVFIIPAFLLFALAAPVWAGPLVPKNIPGDAAVVAHLDLEAFWRSDLYKTVTKELAAEMDEAKAELAGDLGPFDIKMLLDIGSVTFWARGDDAEQGAVIIDGGKTAEIISLLDKLPDHKTQNIKGVTIHSIADQAYLAIHGSFVIVSRRAEEVRHTIDVMDGKSPSMAKKSKGLAKSIRGAFLVVAVTDQAAKALRQHTQSVLLSKGEIKSALLQVGERKGDLYAQVDIDTDAPDVAQKLAQVLQGGAAFLSMAADTPELSRVLGTLKVNTTRSLLSAEISVDTPMVVDFIKREL